ATLIADRLNTVVGQIQIDKFSDGEILPNIKESVRSSHCFIVCDMTTSDGIIESLLIVDAFKRASAKSINIILPYYGYARQDRKNRLRVPIGAKLFANLFTEAGVQRIITIDLHAS